jgi:hypothetical protein
MVAMAVQKHDNDLIPRLVPPQALPRTGAPDLPQSLACEIIWVGLDAHK